MGFFVLSIGTANKSGLIKRIVKKITKYFRGLQY